MVADAYRKQEFFDPLFMLSLSRQNCASLFGFKFERGAKTVHWQVINNVFFAVAI
jgi:hypothetical protein